MRVEGRSSLDHSISSTGEEAACLRRRLCSKYRGRWCGRCGRCSGWKWVSSDLAYGHTASDGSSTRGSDSPRNLGPIRLMTKKAISPVMNISSKGNPRVAKVSSAEQKMANPEVITLAT